MDTTALGWAVQRVDPHAGILFHCRRGARVERGQPFATLYATTVVQLAEPEAMLKRAIHFSPTPPNAVPLVSRVFTHAQAEEYLRQRE